MISLIYEPTNRAFQILVESGDPLFYGVNLSTGAVSTSYLVSAITATNVYSADMSLSDTSGVIFVLVRHDNGFHMYSYNIVTGTFILTKTSTTFMSYFVKKRVGLSYYGGLLISNSNAHIAKVSGSGEISQGNVFVLTTSADTFATASALKGYSLVTDITLITASFSLFTISNTTLTTSSPGSYSQSPTGIFQSDIVYRNGNLEELYIQENKSGSVSYGFPCSQSGGNSVSSTLMTHFNGETLPAWVSLAGDNENVNVVAPAYTGTSDNYYFGVRSTVLGESVDEYGTITVYY